MATPRSTGNWEEHKAKLTEKFAALTENNLLFTEDKKEEMLQKLQAKLGRTREELLQIIERL